MITAEDARALFDYDPESGVLTAKLTRGRWIAGGRAGREDVKQNGKRYRNVMVAGRTYKEHRLIWLIVHGVFPPGPLDHIDGDGTNNRLSNLRLVTSSDNSKNRRKPKHNTSGAVGVYFDKTRNQWWAEVLIGGRKKRLGWFTDKSMAAQVRKQAERELGYHANHGTDRPL